MSLYLYEITPAHTDADHLLKEIDALTQRLGGELIEAQITTARRIFAIAEFSADAPSLDPAALGDAEIAGPHQVRLVGAALDELKAARPAAGYLVEWDLPAELDMDSYLARKKANAPRYADVPEVSFLRTYVREDMDKCLCFYNAPDEAAVRRARDAVSTPIDRLHRLDEDRR
ncbi:DUF4242 domain-containing protein [Mycolicibacterium sphagni]|uniref:DUF4242 domain-containing protein n=1 Tax=Mycolicibacterium sphagni TaxID=1786 RepID=A0A255DUI3_9MYCO|nr:DUF4242 domain-containing protein [Mycolicibacterium sphagni]MCV7176096.1 DUF4242 domain-containing protein [Mycolicibacterium sphagni]OYN82720.1 hypothetical protein CG716_00405 [Mycolicibacterium sphagni]